MWNPPSQTGHAGRREFVQGVTAVVAALFGGAANARRPVASRPPDRPVPSFGPVRQIDAGDLSIGYVEVGPADGPAVILFHGWPYDIHSFAEVAPLLVEQGYRAIIPHLRGHGTTTFRSPQTPRNGQPAALAADGVALMDALGIRQAIVGGFDWGARTAAIMAVLWPQRCRALVSVSGYLIGNRAAAARPLLPRQELQWWYQFYFATERGKAGYAANTSAFNRQIWELASPKWRFDEATFLCSAAAFANPDHVAVVIHNYRWRLSLAEGEARYNEAEARLAAGPPIATPTITLEGDANGAPHLDPSSYRAKFIGPYAHRLVSGGIGHNLPQEAPAAFARAIIDAGRLA